MGKDFFQEKAEHFDKTQYRLENVDNIANAIKNSIPFDRSMEIMDFGSGTGLLLERIAPLVNSITAVDISQSMNAQLEKKLPELPCPVEIIALDLSTSVLDKKFHGIISSMTLHHIDDTPAILKKMHSLLHPGGFIALADLDEEDGHFHNEDTGVCHHGFNRQTLLTEATAAGFKQANIVTASVARKPQGNYPIFLLTAKA